ncbi:hypothetical protein A3J61_00180 [Candidatus Nomurabacteria bacterium RIFCSPHIGHO2_02_FULL_38_15]|uniref:AAA+ ATPase domain-containing protein n=1 Tax=Candidatus Nomurabacteria bacterium RIFCSPHIGHO2_02_FULL_38_15 TaxID=1801752 RepID=A0A1F6VTB7_9BACT|nr:MAG: hypothetical protein A3J61_00180 [Candidatus Nomurabacteria bacterium RIFCSPHIGHO2_02_FULL_38_15]
MTQAEALNILKTGASVFLTGEPGAGKTHTINEYVSYLRAHNIEPAITASTGIAATHIGGMTIHSWSGVGIKNILTPYDIDKIATTEYVVRRISRTKVLIIDEVSMLGPGMLDMVSAVCSEIKQNPQPFGGMQVIFVGDFFQLPPVKETVFAYSSPAWARVLPIVCYLHEQHRQDDHVFLNILSAIRRNEFNEDHFKHIEGRKFTKEAVTGHYPKLFSRNINVDLVNTEMLNKINADTQTFTMTSSGNNTLVANLTKSCLSPELLCLKVGAHVMCTKNNSKEGYVNGTLGVVTGFTSDSKYPIIKTNNNKNIVIEPMDWIIEENNKIKAQISQVPLRLAWAITVHKSQGMSMDKAVMDLTDVFEYGQGYVALSRVRNLEGLYLLGYNARAFEVHPEVLQKDAEFRTLSDMAQTKFENLGIDETNKMHKNFIIASGGNIVADNEKVKNRNIKKENNKNKLATATVTLNLWNEGMDVHEIAKARKLTPQTIWGHIEDLVLDGKITHPALGRLMTDKIKKILPKISEAFKKLNTDKLTPIHEHFKGEYTYDEIRIVRILLPRN